MLAQDVTFHDQAGHQVEPTVFGQRGRILSRR